MNRVRYGILWVFEILLILLVALLLWIPILDYSRREFEEWYRHPSAETARAFREKHDEEFRFRMIIAAPVAAGAVFLAVALVRGRAKPKKIE
jgi:hypothetical protein